MFQRCVSTNDTRPPRKTRYAKDTVAKGWLEFTTTRPSSIVVRVEGGKKGLSGVFQRMDFAKEGGKGRKEKERKEKMDNDENIS